MVESDVVELYVFLVKINDFKIGFVINYLLLLMVFKFIIKVL